MNLAGKEFSLLSLLTLGSSSLLSIIQCLIISSIIQLFDYFMFLVKQCLLLIILVGECNIVLNQQTGWYFLRNIW